VRAEIGLIGDAALTLEALLAELEAISPGARDASAMIAEIGQVREAWLAEWMPRLTSNEAR